MGNREARARFLADLITGYAGRDASILEVGCRSGDNLSTLLDAGFTDLAGVEGDTERVAELGRDRPGLDGSARVYAGPVRELLSGMETGAFDLVFTVGFLFDKEGDYDWLFAELVRLTAGHLVFIESESAGPFRATFEALGMRQVEERDLRRLSELDSVFTARVFEKEP